MFFIYIAETYREVGMASISPGFLAMKTCHPIVVAVAVRGAALKIFGRKQLLFTMATAINQLTLCQVPVRK